MNAIRTQQLQKFCSELGINLQNLKLLDVALTHSSYAHEAKKHPQYNERIEFLGDSVLSIIVSTYMFMNYPKMSEGLLTKYRAHLVCEASLYRYAKNMGIGECLLLGRGEELGGGRQRASILADAFESVLGAVYIDQGFEYAQKYLLNIMQADIDATCTYGINSDYKTRLQEKLQRNGDISIVYDIIGSSGPEHRKEFVAEVSVEGKPIGKGSGFTKKDAEQQAAKQALENV